MAQNNESVLPGDGSVAPFKKIRKLARADDETVDASDRTGVTPQFDDTLSLQVVARAGGSPKRKRVPSQGGADTSPIVYTDLSLNPCGVSPEELEDLLDQCARLFSEHYGNWRPTGKPVKMKQARLRRDHVDADGARLVHARDGDKIVGHVFGVVFKAELTDPKTRSKETHSVAWLTQLVVHTDYRRQGVASKLCRMIWASEHTTVCGLVTSHPYAVKALEKACLLHCDPRRILVNAEELLKQSPVPYVRGRPIVSNEHQSVIGTDFDVDHTDIQKILTESRDSWRLGELADKWEFFAFVFEDQRTGEPGAL